MIPDLNKSEVTNVFTSKTLKQQNWLQPRESLNGHCIINLFLNAMDLPKKQLQREHLEHSSQDTILMMLIKDSKDKISKLDNLKRVADLFSEPFEVWPDLTRKNPILTILESKQPYLLQDIMNTLIDHIMSCPASIQHHNVMMACLPRLLELDFTPKSYLKFFEDHSLSFARKVNYFFQADASFRKFSTILSEESLIHMLSLANGENFSISRLEMAAHLFDEQLTKDQ